MAGYAIVNKLGLGIRWRPAGWRRKSTVLAAAAAAASNCTQSAPVMRCSANCSRAIGVKQPSGYIVAAGPKLPDVLSVCKIGLLTRIEVGLTSLQKPKSPSARLCSSVCKVEGVMVPHRAERVSGMEIYFMKIDLIQKLLIGIVLASALSILVPAPQAVAMTKAAGICKHVYMAQGEKQLPWFGLPRRAARKAWRRKVMSSRGARWASWRRARGRSYRCRNIPNSFYKICVVRARPCRAR